MSMSWRLASRLSVITLALLVVLIVALLSLHNGIGGTTGNNTNANQSGLQGTDLASLSAPDFRLKDQYGKTISLAGFKEKHVVLTFLYKHCPDMLPFTPHNLHNPIQLFLTHLS